MTDNEDVGRRKPARGVLSSSDQPTIIFVTVCSEKRLSWIAQPAVDELLKEVWRQADAWLVGYYLLMPDHVHFFAGMRNDDIPFNRWMSFWKGSFSKKTADLSMRGTGREDSSATDVRNPGNWKWQSLHWDTRLRRSESYSEKWNYVRENPLRKGLVKNADAWPYQGMLNSLRW